MTRRFLALDLVISRGLDKRGVDQVLAMDYCKHWMHHIVAAATSETEEDVKVHHSRAVPHI